MSSITKGINLIFYENIGSYMIKLHPSLNDINIECV